MPDSPVDLDELETRGPLDDLRDQMAAAKAEMDRLNAEDPISEASLAAMTEPPWLARMAAELRDARKALEAVERLAVLQWPTDREGYPNTDAGQHAAAAVKCCENELRAALALAKGPRTDGD